MSFPNRPSTLSELGRRLLNGADAGIEVKEFLHEFEVAASAAMFSVRPPQLTGSVEHGDRLDAYLQALAVFLCARLNVDPPEWTQPVLALPQPWFASPGPAIRNYLPMSSPAPFRRRNLFVDEDSLRVA